MNTPLRLTRGEPLIMKMHRHHRSLRPGQALLLNGTGLLSSPWAFREVPPLQRSCSLLVWASPWFERIDSAFAFVYGASEVLAWAAGPTRAMSE